MLLERRIVRKKKLPVKILSGGELSKKLTISAHAFSKSAREKIEGAGGTATLIDGTEKGKAQK